jgi:hypothetical protein
MLLQLTHQVGTAIAFDGDGVWYMICLTWQGQNTMLSCRAFDAVARIIKIQTENIFIEIHPIPAIPPALPNAAVLRRLRIWLLGPLVLLLPWCVPSSDKSSRKKALCEQHDLISVQACLSKQLYMSQSTSVLMYRASTAAHLVAFSNKASSFVSN